MSSTSLSPMPTGCSLVKVWGGAGESSIDRSFFLCGGAMGPRVGCSGEGVVCGLMI